MAADPLSAWAREMRQVFRTGTTSQFILYGNVFDLQPVVKDSGGTEYVSLRRFLTDAMFAPFDVVLLYDRGKGIRVRKGGDHAWVVLQKDGQNYILESAGGPKFYRRIPPRAEFLPDYFPAIHFNRKGLWFRTGSQWTADYHSQGEWARKP